MTHRQRWNAEQAVKHPMLWFFVFYVLDMAFMVWRWDLESNPLLTNVGMIDAVILKATVLLLAVGGWAVVMQTNTRSTRRFFGWMWAFGYGTVLISNIAVILVVG